LEEKTSPMCIRQSYMNEKKGGAGKENCGKNLTDGSPGGPNGRIKSLGLRQKATGGGV